MTTPSTPWSSPPPLASAPTPAPVLAPAGGDPPAAVLATKDEDVRAILDVRMEKPAGLVPYQAHTPAEQQRIQALMGEIDVHDTNSIIAFGARAQDKSRQVASQMIDGVRNKDAGVAGPLLNDLVANIRGFKVDDLIGKNNPGWFARLLGAVRPAVKLLQRYETVNKQVMVIRNKLEDHKHTLARDVAMLDRLYKASIEHFHELELYIAAGEERLRILADQEIPALAAQAQASGDPLQAQEVTRLEAARADLERKVHDLRLTRQVVMQSIPSLSLIQENDKSLITKISSMLVNTLPLWEVQVAQSVAIQRSRDAAATVTAVNDLTSDLLVQNAKNLRQANVEVRRQVERGQFDIAAIQKANEELLATIDESRTIYEEGRQKRQEAERTLNELERDLKAALLRAANRTA